jgi:hypothetical protein
MRYVGWFWLFIFFAACLLAADVARSVYVTAPHPGPQNTPTSNTS